MINKLQKVVDHYDELARLMSQPNAMKNIKQFTLMAREHRSLTKLAEHAKQFIDDSTQLQEYEEILLENDDELKNLVKEEILKLRESLILQEKKLKLLLIPKIPNDDKNIILFIGSILILSSTKSI